MAEEIRERIKRLRGELAAAGLELRNKGLEERGIKVPPVPARVPVLKDEKTSEVLPGAAGDDRTEANDKVEGVANPVEDLRTRLNKATTKERTSGKPPAHKK